MIVNELKIHAIRNFDTLRLSLNPRFTFIVGNNGTGKTAIIEALYLLSRGQSFRSHEIAPIIKHGEKKCTVYACSKDNDTVSIQKSINSPTVVKINHQFCTSTSQLAHHLPCQLLYQNLFEIIDLGSTVRRNILDWGLFHVKHEYLLLWKNYKRLLLQRNTLLKQRAAQNLLFPWDQQLSEVAEKITLLRQNFFDNWQLKFQEVLVRLTDIPCQLKFYKGWDKKGTGKDLQTILNETYLSDMQRQYTQQGAHQADILITTNEYKYKAKKTLSRGQQKMILIALKLSQGFFLNKQCLYLFDDYSAELDTAHQERLLKYLAQCDGQYVLTSINAQNFDKFYEKENLTVINI